MNNNDHDGSVSSPAAAATTPEGACGAEYVSSDEGKEKKAGYTVDMMASEIHVPAQYLKDNFHCVATNDNGEKCVRIPYVDEYGCPGANAVACALGNIRVKNSSNHTIYNIDRAIASGSKTVIICQVESDVHIADYCGVAAVCLHPGYKIPSENAGILNRFDSVVIAVPGDFGGHYERYIAGVLSSIRYKGQVGVVDINIYTEYMAVCEADEDSARSVMSDTIAEAIQSARIIDIETVVCTVPRCRGAVLCKLPSGYDYDDAGTYIVDDKGHGTRIYTSPVFVNSVSSLDGRVYYGIKCKEGERWVQRFYPADILLCSNKIADLVSAGIACSSAIASASVHYMSEYIAENEVRIASVVIAEQLGWTPDMTAFILPTIQSEIVIGENLRVAARGYHQVGGYENWKELLINERENYRLRFCVSAALATPLLAILGVRGFFLYLTGHSGGGKSAAQKLAMSCWGNEEELSSTFSNSGSYVEGVAAASCDLPINIDERQTVGSGAETQALLESIVYLIVNGRGKGRCNKDATIKQIKTWHTIALGSGEESIIRACTKDGVRNRVLLISTPPFDGREDVACQMHNEVLSRYGYAGPDMVAYYLSLGSEKIREVYIRMHDCTATYADGVRGTHIDDIAVVATACYLASMHIFGQTEEDAFNDTLQMIAAIADDNRYSEVTDVDKNGAQYIGDWISKNSNRMSKDYRGNDRCGLIDDGVAYVLTTELNQDLSANGYIAADIIKFICDAGVLIHDKDGIHKTVRKVISAGCSKVRVYAIRLDVLSSIE